MSSRKLSVVSSGVMVEVGEIGGGTRGRDGFIVLCDYAQVFGGQSDTWCMLGAAINVCQVQPLRRFMAVSLFSPRPSKVYLLRLLALMSCMFVKQHSFRHWRCQTR